MIDNANRFFGNRIIAGGNMEKSLDMLNLNAENVVIIDDQVEVWRKAD